jgi:hypothetical protein
MVAFGFWLLPNLVLAQQRTFTLQGKVLSNAETLPGASVAVPALNTGVTADANGKYVLVLPAGRHELVVSFIGYQNLTRTVNLRADQQLKLHQALARN